ncbi:hypothetical protein [Chloroflexus sp.]|uniref:hypothetical protein n=1 Tax=Chloroflexus sp. TaxID=1904827 RepID=UPI00298EF9E7|nr:hypothetical protein [Chloroflexus sp.]MDW8405858.1 hypothetical protein [Chloroflexus sp.]
MLKTASARSTVSALPLPLMVIPAIITMTAIVIIFGAILIQNNSFFTYTLDDPYIHLALAENITRGHYGVNENEFSSPSSSIVWPFLLAIFGANPFAPLVINIIVTGCFALLLPRTIQVALNLSNTKTDHVIILFLSLLIIFTTNIIGLAFTGMEHSLQVLCTLLIAYGLIIYARYHRLPAWMPIALVMAPLVRYENLAISLLVALFLVIQGKRWHGLAVIALIGILVGGFSLFLMSLGLAPLPASIIVKSTTQLSQSEVNSILLNIVVSVFTRPGLLVLSLLLLIVTGVFLSIIDSAKKPVAFVAILAILAHMMFGKYGAYSRYEIYLLIFTIVMIIYLFDATIMRLFQRHKIVNVALVLTLWTTTIFGSWYIKTVFSTPLAAANIYQQQYQMHRFVTEYYRQPVAVNDIGYVSYHNNHYVLDLWGLSSYETLLRYYKQPDWLATIVRDYDIKLVMVYEDEFNIPKQWFKVGELRLGVPQISAAGSRVSFYATEREAIDGIYVALQRFVPTLPRDATFTFTNIP